MDNLFTGHPDGNYYRDHYTSNKSNLKNLVSIIGPLSELYTELDPHNKKTRNIVESIIELSSREDHNQTTTNESLQNLLNGINGI